MPRHSEPEDVQGGIVLKLEFEFKKQRINTFSFGEMPLDNED